MSMKLNNKEGGQAMWKEIKEDVLEIGSVLIGARSNFPVPVYRDQFSG